MKKVTREAAMHRGVSERYVDEYLEAVNRKRLKSMRVKNRRVEILVNGSGWGIPVLLEDLIDAALDDIPTSQHCYPETQAWMEAQAVRETLNEARSVLKALEFDRNATLKYGEYEKSIEYDE